MKTSKFAFIHYLTKYRKYDTSKKPFKSTFKPTLNKSKDKNKGEKNEMNDNENKNHIEKINKLFDTSQENDKQVEDEKQAEDEEQAEGHVQSEDQAQAEENQKETEEVDTKKESEKTKGQDVYQTESEENSSPTMEIFKDYNWLVKEIDRIGQDLDVRHLIELLFDLYSWANYAVFIAYQYFNYFVFLLSRFKYSCRRRSIINYNHWLRSWYWLSIVKLSI
jgi:DNA mismatch repair ATPase MutL